MPDEEKVHINVSEEPEEQEKVTVFVSGSCSPCHEVRELIEQGRFNKADVDLVDVETDQGFPEIEKRGLTKVPCCYRGTQECKLKIDDENHALIIECPGDEEAEEPPEIPS